MQKSALAWSLQGAIEPKAHWVAPAGNTHITITITNSKIGLSKYDLTQVSTVKYIKVRLDYILHLEFPV